MHRTFVRAAVLFALLLLCPALAQATPAPNQYTAADTIGGAHVDIDALRKTAFFKALQREATKERDVADTLNKMKADWRFDPFKDLSGATVFVGPDVNGGKDFLAVFEGKFSEPAIVRHIRSKVGADGLKEVDGSGGKHYTLEADQFAFAFRGKRAFVGSRARVLHALDPQGHPAPSAGGLAAPADSTVQLYPKVRKDVESETLWAALATTAVLRKQLGMVGSNTLRSVALGITITEGAKLQLRARFEDAAQAARIHSELVSELRAAENDEGLKRMKLVDVVKRTVVKLDGVEIAVGLDLPKAQLEQLRAALLPILFG